MSNSNTRAGRGLSVLAAAIATVLLAACAAAPVKPAGAEDARAKLIELQTDPNLANLAPSAMADAEAAVRTAEIPQRDRALADYRVYIADRKVGIAKAEAQTRFAENQRATITAQQTSARLDARTREADRAQVEASAATAAAANSAAQAESATNRADAQAAASAQQSAEMQQQIDALKAKATDRGLVLTLGDVLFTSGRAELKTGATGHLDQLVAFLNRYPDRTVMIEGYTDNVGTADYNQGLSERRAQAVRSYLTNQGIAQARLSATGKGEADPVTGNDTAAGRQRNRRVEVVINTAAVTSMSLPPG